MYIKLSVLLLVVKTVKRFNANFVTFVYIWVCLHHNMMLYGSSLVALALEIERFIAHYESLKIDVADY